VEAVEPRLFAYAFPGGSAGGHPSAVLCFSGNRRFKERDLARLLDEFARRTQDLNSTRVKKHKYKKFEFKPLETRYGQTTVYYIELTPAIVANFAPGVCVVNDRVFVATYYKDLEHVLPRQASDADRIPTAYYLRVSDPGLKSLVSYLKKSLSDPGRKRRLGGEAEFARRIERVGQLERYAANVGSIEIRDTGTPVLEALAITIRRRAEKDNHK
jgi:hypothetical protein